MKDFLHRLPAGGRLLAQSAHRVQLDTTNDTTGSWRVFSQVVPKPAFNNERV
jgi:hypothetical protein